VLVQHSRCRFAQKMRKALDSGGGQEMPGLYCSQEARHAERG
jgi:hypothetical protein